MPPPSPSPPSFSFPFGFDFGQTAKNFASAFIYANRNILKIYGSFTAICSFKSIRFLTSAPPLLCSCLPGKPVQRRKKEKKQLPTSLCSVCAWLRHWLADWLPPWLRLWLRLHLYLHSPPHLRLHIWPVDCGSPSSVATFNFLQVYLPAPAALPSFLASILGFVCSLLIFIELALVTA